MPVTKTPRIEVVDALRGFAIMAIFLVHSLEHFIFPVYPVNPPAWLNTLDQGVITLIFSLFAGKAYALFALLFGFTFYIQSRNQREKGKDFGYRFLWRLVLLIAFAALNAAFFPGGDALLSFVIIGLVLFVARNWKDHAILIVSIIFLLQPVEWFHYAAHLVNPDYTLPNLGTDALYATVTEANKTGDFASFLLANVTTGQKASFFWAVGAGRTLQTAGLFLLGLYLGRKQFFLPTGKNNRFWIKILIVAAIVSTPLYQLREVILTHGELTQKTAGTAFDMWQKLSFTFILISSFVLLYQKDRFRNAVSNLRIYGKMSLTNYISQSILGAIVYFPFGLNLAPYCGYTVSLLIGIALIMLQIRFCKWWLARHRQGPLESLWHKWTWLRSTRK